MALGYSESCCTNASILFIIQHSERVRSFNAVILNVLKFLHRTILVPHWKTATFLIVVSRMVTLSCDSHYVYICVVPNDCSTCTMSFRIQHYDIASTLVRVPRMMRSRTP